MESTTKAITCTGSEIKITGEITAGIDLMGFKMSTRILVVKGLANDCLLGYDALATHPETAKGMTQLTQTLRETKHVRPEIKQDKENWNRAGIGTREAIKICNITEIKEVQTDEAREASKAIGEIMTIFEEVFITVFKRMDDRLFSKSGFTSSTEK